MIEIKRATPSDAKWMQNGFDTHMGWTKKAGYFAECCQLQENGQVVLFHAADGDTFIGHVKVVWKPNYPYFRENNIPEIQDLNVIPAYRRQGVATKLVDACEQVIRARSKIAGIGFGLYSDYGAAQRMYVGRGYIPDGMGISYWDEYVTPGQSVNVDDSLVLHLIKHL